MSVELHDALHTAFDQLKLDQEAKPEWHHNSDSIVQDLVHPSMYPLVYGRFRVIRTWAGKDTVIPTEVWNEERDAVLSNIGSGNVTPSFWSDTFQWLPANVLSSVMAA